MTENNEPCPVCGEGIKSVAKKCKHCKEFLDKPTSWHDWWRHSLAEIRGDKTLWDFFNLLIVPIILAGLGIWFNLSETRRQEELELDRATAQAEVELDRSQEAALQNYYDEMTSLLINNKLRNFGPGDEVWILAQARTVATLRQLDPVRRNILLGFLSQADLVSEDDPVQILREANLSKADLGEADLYDADLSDAKLHEAYLLKANLHIADLRRADLSGAILIGADLGGANLHVADLRRADLRGADLSGSILREALYNHDTKWPDGFDPQARGAFKVE